MATRFRDMDVRVAAKAQLLRHARRCADTLVIDELGIEHGASRVDIAVINGHIRGLEIKADADTLERLPRQVEAYGRVVDRATLIAAERHVASAMELLPEWWGVISVVRCGNGAVAFRRVRAERTNRGIDGLTLARLLWRREVIDLLVGLGRDAKLLERRRRPELYAELSGAVSLPRLRKIVRDTLKERRNWRDRARPSSYDGSSPPTAMC